jgi:orotate phosphoribosyltransferase
MVLDKKVAEQTVNYLIQINAIKLNTKKPFTWTSGIKSPIYCDNRLILSFPDVRKFVADKMTEIVENKYGKDISIAGVATGAIAIGAMIAERINVPYAYVRPEPKGHGLKNQIEGNIKKESNVVVIEDLISTGKSSLNAINALKSEGYNVLGMLSIFSYNFQFANKKFEDENILINSLSDYNSLVNLIQSEGTLEINEISRLKKWREDPKNLELVYIIILISPELYSPIPNESILT